MPIDNWTHSFIPYADELSTPHCAHSALPSFSWALDHFSSTIDRFPSTPNLLNPHRCFNWLSAIILDCLLYEAGLIFWLAFDESEMPSRPRFQDRCQRGNRGASRYRRRTAELERKPLWIRWDRRSHLRNWNYTPSVTVQCCFIVGIRPGTVWGFGKIGTKGWRRRWFWWPWALWSRIRWHRLWGREGC